MTKQEILSAISQRLGDSTSGFEDPILSNIFDQVIAEMASRDCIRSLRKTATFTFTDSVRGYDTQTLTGLTGTDWPMDFVSLIVPSWGPSYGMLLRKSEEEFLQWRLEHTDTDGNPVTSKPRIWCLTPNEQTLQVDPVPGADDVPPTDGVEAIYIAPPTVLALGDDLTEIRREFIPVIIAGAVKYGARFQDETLNDVPQATRDFETGMLRMRGQAQRDRGRTYRSTYRDY